MKSAVKTVVIIETSMHSTQLPGKLMLRLGDKTVLGQILTRCFLIYGVDEICCVIPDSSEHDILAEESNKYSAIIFRSKEKNALESYYKAAVFINADVIIRITSNCPLINPAICSKVLNLHVKTNSQYTCNNMPPSWPYGYECEVFGIEQLEKAYNNKNVISSLEHLSDWMKANYNVVNFSNPDGNIHYKKVALDTPEDYVRIANFFNSNCYSV